MPSQNVLKVLDIGYITVLYFTLGYFVSIFVNKIVGPFDEAEAKRKTVSLLFLEVLFHMYIMGLLIYFLRNIVVKIPSPFEGIGGFQHQRVPELKSSFVLSFVLLYYQRTLKHKLDHLSKRMIGS